MEKHIYTAKTAEEAVEVGLKELGLTREDVEIEVLEEGKKKLIGSVLAEVAITVKEKLTDGQRAVKFLEGLFPLIGVEATPTLSEEEEKIVIQLEAGANKGIIGRRGEVIDAIQTIAGAVANIGRRDYRRVVVDCGNYREEREETLKRVAEKMAAKAVRIGKRVRLEPMNPYERRIIHSALAENGEVTTRSEGKEPARFVVITPKNMRSGDRRNGNRDRDRGHGRNGGRNDRNMKYGDKKPYPKRELPKESTPESSGTGFRKGGFSGFFGTYLGNSRDDEPTPDTTETIEMPATPETSGTAFKKDEE